MKILLVEDDPNLRDTTKAFLEYNFPSIIAVPSAEDALKLLESDQEIKIVFTDFILIMGGGEMNGIDLTKIIKKISPNIKVILTSRNGIQDQALAAGADYFINKSEDGDVIIQTIKQCIQAP
jgi:CheY-like chemotaxis protein